MKAPNMNEIATREHAKLIAERASAQLDAALDRNASNVGRIEHAVVWWRGVL